MNGRHSCLNQSFSALRNIDCDSETITALITSVLHCISVPPLQHPIQMPTISKIVCIFSFKYSGWHLKMYRGWEEEKKKLKNYVYYLLSLLQEFGDGGQHFRLLQNLVGIRIASIATGLDPRERHLLCSANHGIHGSLSWWVEITQLPN